MKRISTLQFLSSKIKHFFNNGAMMALFGVIIGGLITGFFSYKTQEANIKAQQDQFKINYYIEKNKGLKNELSKYIDGIGYLLSHCCDDIDKSQQLSDMMACSIRISVLYNKEIGNSCIDLTNEMRVSFKDLKYDSKKAEIAISNWNTSINKEMELMDIAVNNNIDKEIFEILKSQNK